LFRVVAVFGSSLPSIDKSLGSVCSALHIPYLTTNMAPVNRVKSDYSLYLGPTQMDLIEVVVAIIEKLKWQEVALVSHRETGEIEFSCLMYKNESFDKRGNIAKRHWCTIAVPSFWVILNLLRSK
jgi:hypothetical protein